MGNRMDSHNIFSICVAYIHERLQEAGPENRDTIFRVACLILAPSLQRSDAAALCSAVGLSEAHIPTFHEALDQWQGRTVRY